VSVTRALAVLDLLADASEGRGVSDIARELGVHKSSASRLLATLRGGGLIEVNPSGRLELGAGFLRLAARVVQRTDIAQIALPFLRDLTARSGETAYVSVRRGSFRTAIQEVESPNPVRMVAGIGHLYPLHAGAPGKVLLASLPEAEVSELLRSVPQLHGVRSRAVARIRGDLERARRAGYAISFEENIPNASSIAVPVSGHLGTVVAALGIAGVAPRWNRKRMSEFLPVLRANAREIGEILGASQTAANSADRVSRRGSV
jgi:IclR family acetate operon transcriptional repressor